MAKDRDKELKAAHDYIRKLNIVSTKGPQANAPAEFVEEKADPQVFILTDLIDLYAGLTVAILINYY